MAEALGTDIVNADSTQVVRSMDVGTDKVSAEDQARVRHHLLDLVDPDEPYTAADYVRDARRVIADLLEAGKVPIVCGGTGFYIRALLDGLFPQPAIDPDIRARLNDEADANLAALYERLEREDPTAAEGIEPADRFRIVRALEVLDSTGEPISAHWERHRREVAQEKPPASPREAAAMLKHAAGYDTLKVGITRSRESLYARIDARAVNQIHDGHLEAEVRALLERYPATLPAFKALTYRHMIQILQGTWSYQEALENLQRDTRRYAKRQLTWFRRDETIRWFELPQDYDAARNTILEFAASL